MKVHCLFEQSGTFKNAFKKYGIEAYDYDIQNEFGETDNVMDIFSEIEGGYLGKPSIFDNFSENDIVFAFFPCTRFEAKIPLSFRGESTQQKKWSDEQNCFIPCNCIMNCMNFMKKISQLVIVCIRKNIKLIIENPYTQPHYLSTYWCFKTESN